MEAMVWGWDSECYVVESGSGMLIELYGIF
jgi:hypothetical protein